MPEKFDLLRVNYIDGEHLAGLCYAPCYTIKEGDTVETAIGRAFVVKREGYVTKDEKLWQMITGLIPVHRVLFVLIPVKYEEDE